VITNLENIYFFFYSVGAIYDMVRITQI